MARARATDFLNCLFDSDDTVTFRAINDKKEEDSSAVKLSCECGRFSEIADTLKKYNEDGMGIFFCPNSGGDTDESIIRINAQFIDIDEGTPEEQMKKINSFPKKPSIIIKTSRGMHVYWIMSGNPKIEDFRPLQKRLAKYFGSDPKCVNESRLMRLPGFKHCKRNPHVDVAIEDFHPERRYTQDELSDALPEMDETPVEQKSGNGHGLYLILSSCDFIKHCKDDADTLSEPDWFAMISNLAPFKKGAETIQEYSTPYPEYSKGKTQKKINHVLNDGIKPITCQTIHEQGFHCPKYESGECSAKAPAALAYLPLTGDALVQLVEELPVSGKIMKDIQTSKSFVEDYMYNQDPATSGEIILEELPNHFRLSKDHFRPLKSVYKEVRKDYKSNPNQRRVKEGDDLPEWYLPTDSGPRLMPGVLAKNMAEAVPLISVNGQMLIYVDGVYKEISDTYAQRMIQEKLVLSQSKMSQIKDATYQWQLQVQHEIKELNPNPYIINLKNGLYNVLDSSISLHTPEYFSTIQLNLKYDETADCPVFKKFLSDSMVGDKQQVQLIQEILGYLLIPITHAQKSFIFDGAANAGKSLLLLVISDILLGRENVSHVAWQELGARFKTAQLYGKLANIFADLPTQNLDNDNLFKALVGEDILEVEKKNKDPFSFQNKARLVFSCNDLPKNYNDRTEGFYRRLIIIHFNHTVPEEKRDPDLLEKFKKEADGIFLFALQGLQRLINNNYVFSETQTNKDELQRYREESNSVLIFVRDRCHLYEDGSEWTGSTELHKQYLQFCKEEGYSKPFGQNNFTNELIKAFPFIHRSSTGKFRTLEGIHLAD